MATVVRGSRGWWLALFGLIVGLSFVGGALIVADTIKYVKTLDTSLLTVTGSTQQIISSDTVKWSSSFSRDAPPDNLRTAYAQIQADANQVMQYLTSQAIDRKDMTLFPIAVTPTTEACGQPPRPGCGSTVVSYKLTQTVEVNSSEVDKVTAVAQGSSTLINQGVIFSSKPLEYYFNDLPNLRVQLFADATRDARERAESIAQSTGAHVGGLVSASTGVIQVTPVNSTQISDQGTYDTSTIQKKVTGVVRTQFTLVR